ncbi:MAG: hypothetical protein QXU47_01810 [Candidatus Bathyarchaeia archaeon]
MIKRGSKSLGGMIVGVYKAASTWFGKDKPLWLDGVRVIEEYEEEKKSGELELVGWRMLRELETDEIRGIPYEESHNITKSSQENKHTNSGGYVIDRTAAIKAFVNPFTSRYRVSE